VIAFLTPDGVGVFLKVAGGGPDPGRAAITEISLPTAMARTDLRATYGGLDLAVGIFLWICARRDQWIRPGLVALALTAAGFGGGRPAGRYPVALFPQHLIE
jgi:hypothetical protein